MPYAICLMAVQLSLRSELAGRLSTSRAVAKIIHGSVLLLHCSHMPPLRNCFHWSDPQLPTHFLVKMPHHSQSGVNPLTQLTGSVSAHTIIHQEILHQILIVLGVMKDVMNKGQHSLHFLVK